MGLEKRGTLRERGREKLIERNILGKDAKGMFWKDEVLGRGQGLEKLNGIKEDIKLIKKEGKI